MPDSLHDEIARRAFALFEARGREDGHDWQDWFEAERAVKEDAQTWRLEAPKASLTADIDNATLVLRLGIAVNAVRSAQRFFYACENEPGPGGERDRLSAILIALGFLHEAIQTVLRPNFPRIKGLAEAGGADEDLVKEAGALLSGRLPLTRILDRMRNKLIFHWDDEPIRKFITAYSKETVPWAEGVGRTQAESIYRIAADALTDSMLPQEAGVTQTEQSERNLEKLRELIQHVLPATHCVRKLFQFAIIGHLNTHGAKLRSV